MYLSDGETNYSQHKRSQERENVKIQLFLIDPLTYSPCKFKHSFKGICVHFFKSQINNQDKVPLKMNYALYLPTALKWLPKTVTVPTFLVVVRSE